MACNCEKFDASVECTQCGNVLKFKRKRNESDTGAAKRLGLRCGTCYSTEFK
jgi:hypothetical protein